MATTQLNIRLDSQIKDEGTAAFAELGYTPTQIITSVWEYAARYRKQPHIVKQALVADQIQQSIDVQKKLEAVEKAAADAISLSDDEFMAKAHYFIMAQQLQDKRVIDYEKFIRKVDPQIVKDFINSVVQNFCIKDGRIVSILFKNGMEHQFFYKD